MQIVMGEEELSEAIAAWAAAHGMRGRVNADWQFDTNAKTGGMSLQRIVLSSGRDLPAEAVSPEV